MILRIHNEQEDTRQAPSPPREFSYMYRSLRTLVILLQTLCIGDRRDSIYFKADRTALCGFVLKFDGAVSYCESLCGPSPGGGTRNDAPYKWTMLAIQVEPFYSEEPFPRRTVINVYDDSLHPRVIHTRMSSCTGLPVWSCPCGTFHTDYCTPAMPGYFCRGREAGQGGRASIFSPTWAAVEMRLSLCVGPFGLARYLSAWLGRPLTLGAVHVCFREETFSSERHGTMPSRSCHSLTSQPI